METLLVTVKNNQQVASLVEILQAINFVESITQLDDYEKVRFGLDDINTFAAQTDLPTLSMEEIISEIKTARHEKKLYGH
ncbi:MAG: hypothetical protein JNM36_05525 [Chitinophagales bacterium]|nr:hypothetical protein [Chitinophagales bacterium]